MVHIVLVDRLKDKDWGSLVGPFNTMKAAKEFAASMGTINTKIVSVKDK